MNPNLWIIGGTSDSIIIASRLAAIGVPCLVTVTTETAARAYPAGEWLRVRVGALEAENLSVFIQQEGIGAVLDASHPFAVEISLGAIAAAQALQLPYWRYERPGLQPEEAAPNDADLIKYVPNLEAALTVDLLAGQRVLLILGYRWLGQFRPWQHQATLFARILPSLPALNAALAAGFTPDRLIALRPPIDRALEMALWQQWQITRVITKASGAAGGEPVKIQVAKTLAIPLTIIQRPAIDYPNRYQCHDQITARGQQWWQSVNRRPEFPSIR